MIDLSLVETNPVHNRGFKGWDQVISSCPKSETDLPSISQGFIVMSASWFDENVFQIAAPRSHVPSALRKIYDHAEAVELPPWDPLGALA